MIVWLQICWGSTFLSCPPAHLHFLSARFYSPQSVASSHPFGWLWLDRNIPGSICYLSWIGQTKSLLTFADYLFHCLKNRRWQHNAPFVLMETVCTDIFVFMALLKKPRSLLQVRTVAGLWHTAFSCHYASAVSMSYKFSWTCCPVFEKQDKFKTICLHFTLFFFCLTQVF